MNVYVVDTNIILNDYTNVETLSTNNKVVIPYAVIKELDNFKKLNNSLGYNSRKFSNYIAKELNQHSDTEVLQNRHTISENIVIDTNNYSGTADEQILEACKCYPINEGDTKVLLTNDTNLAIFARLDHILTESYGVSDKDKEYTGVSIIEVEDHEVQTLFDDTSIKIVDGDFHSNEIIAVKSGGKTIATGRCVGGNKIKLIKCGSNNFFLDSETKVKPKNKEQSWLLHLMNLIVDDTIDLLTITGRAGVGKSYIALARAIEMVENGDFKKITLTKPLAHMGGQELGFLPGGMGEKIRPIMESYVTILDKLGYADMSMFSASDVDEKYDNKKSLIKFEPLTYIRGCNLQDIVIIDEAQNLSLHEIKTLVTRMDEGAKIILIADTDQIDVQHLNKHNNGFSQLVEKFKNVEFAAHIKLIKSERSRLAEVAGDLL